MKSKHKLTDKIRILADKPQQKKTVGRNENNNIKNINRKKYVLKSMQYLYYPLKTENVIKSSIIPSNFRFKFFHYSKM